MVTNDKAGQAEALWDLVTLCDIIVWGLGDFFLVPIATIADWLNAFLQRLIPRYRFRRFHEELHRLYISDDAWHPAVRQWNETVVNMLLKNLRERKYV